jgi:hypothetical protein
LAHSGVAIKPTIPLVRCVTLERQCWFKTIKPFKSFKPSDRGDPKRLERSVPRYGPLGLLGKADTRHRSS